MESKAMELYQKRLQNLPAVLEGLYSSVCADEGLKYMNDESLLKYKMNRIAELVQQIMNSEKQKILIRVLEQYEQLKKKVGGGQSSFEEQVNSERERKKLQHIEKLLIQKQLQMNLKEKELEEKDSLIQELIISKSKLEESERNFNKECIKCSLKSEQLRRIKNKEQQISEIVIKLKKQEQEKLIELKTKISYLESDKNEIQKLNIDLQYQVNKLREQNMRPMKENNEKRERIDMLNKHVRFLEEELVQVERAFTTIKQKILFNLLSQIKSLKKAHSALKTHIVQEMQSTEKEMILFVKSKAEKMTVSSQMIRKFSQINSQIDSFIQQQIFH